MKNIFMLAAALIAGSALAASPAGNKLADEANAASTQFTLTARSTVSYGAGAIWAEKTLEPGAYACHPSTFGLPGSMSTPRKQCKLTAKNGGVHVAPVAVTASTLITGQSGTINLATATTVKYGGGGLFVQKTLRPGAHPCTDGYFGDPAPGVPKACYAAPAGDPAPQSANRAGTTDAPATEAPVVAVPPASGGIADPAEYRRVAALMGAQAGMDYLFGTAAGKVSANAYPSAPPSKPMNMVSIQNPNGLGNRGCSFTGWCGSWQYGGPLTYEPGDFSSSITNFGYIPFANPDKSIFKAARYYGVGAAQGIAVGHNTFSIQPEPSWTTWEGETRNNSHNEEQVMRQIEGTAAAGTNGRDIFEGKPVACARGYGRGGWVNNVLCVQSNGYITSHGSNTSRNNMKVKLPAGQVPTAIAVTNSGEFALVTTWDTAAVRGKVWFLAMKDACQGCREEDESKWEANWGQWRNVMPGMPNLGNYIGAKIIGSVDLPADLVAPTGISVTTGRSPERHDGYETVMRMWDTPIDTPAARARYFNGDLKDAVANTGMAVVVSKGENRVAFIDLKPLFDQVRKNWLAPMSNEQFSANLAARGDGDGKFPPTFNDVPSQKPIVVKTASLPSAPTVARAMLLAPYRAVIGTEDGNLRIFDLGANYLNQTMVGSAAAGKPEDIKEIGTYPVGANPTGIAYVKTKGSQAKDGVRALWGYEKDDSFLWALSRGEKRASLLQWNANRTSFSTFMTLQDSRMTDPVAIEDSDNHGTESYVVNIASGSSLLNYAYGPIVMWTYGDQQNPPCSPAAPCGPTVKKAIEFGGEYKVPGNVFYVGGGNIN